MQIFQSGLNIFRSCQRSKKSKKPEKYFFDFLFNLGMAIDIVPRKAWTNIFATFLQNKLIFYENPIK
jgi:hypothetical protein